MIAICISIALFVFLLIETNGPYEYCRLGCLILLGRLQDSRGLLGYDSFKEKRTFMQYVRETYAFDPTRHWLLGFSLRLITCMVCLGTLLTVIAALIVHPTFVLVYCYLTICLIGFLSFWKEKIRQL